MYLITLLEIQFQNTGLCHESYGNKK